VSAWLVDTQALLWFLTNDPRLTADAKQTMESGESVLLVSAASIWEMAIKSGLGKLRVPDNLPAILSDQGFESLAIEPRHAWAVRALPVGAHQDPFDRLLAAQARVEDLPVISSDAAFDAYGVKRLW
jgi:PIN domain nuclease of toxin-antitoxin system